VVLYLSFLCAPVTAAGAVFAPNGCGESEYEPELIVLACADANLVFEVEEWVSWDASKAIATGALKHPDFDAPGPCQRAATACPWVESEATLFLDRPAWCQSNKRRQFTRLILEAPNDSDPSLHRTRRDFRCSEYAPARPVLPRLATAEAARFMRNALFRHPGLAFEAGYARKVKCNQRVSRIRVRCKMSWYVGDLSFEGKGAIWLSFSGGVATWNYAYRVRRRNTYCQVTGGSDCVDIIRVR
jgi:hypothetical protein